MIKELLWPERCPFCGKASGEGICPACRKVISKLVVREPRCKKCGKPLCTEEQEFCYDCMRMKHHYNKGYSLWLHQPPVSTSIYQFKYHNQRAFARIYAKEIVACYGEWLQKLNVDYMVPVPIHPLRKRKRGYNQAEILAREIGKLINVPVNNSLIKRIRYTNPQKTLDSKDRKRNLKDAFCICGKKKVARRVLIVDDIYTTGNTIDEMARLLKEKGAENVSFLTISIGQGY